MHIVQSIGQKTLEQNDCVYEQEAKSEGTHLSPAMEG